MPRKNKYATNRDLARAVRKKLKISEGLARKVIDRYFEEIKATVLQSEHVNLMNFGTFDLTTWKSGSYYSINEKRKVQKELKTVSFKSSPQIKKRLNN